MSLRRRTLDSRALVLLLGLVPGFVGCSGEDPAAAAERSSAQAAVTPRSADPRLVQLRQAIEFGRVDLAETLLAQVGDIAGAEAPLLRARIAVLRGDALAALQEIEAARQVAGDGGAARVHACAAEIYAILGRFEAAAQELEAGLALGGSTADLARATGVVLILQPGGASQGLDQLEAALEMDAETPFLDRALSQAHLLEGRRALSDGRPRDAMVHALRAVEHDPEELDVKELEADCRQVLNDFEGALAILHELHAAGRDTLGLQADLHQRAGTYELFHKNRVAAVDHYVRARALGLDDATLGFGATVLAEEADVVVDRGIDAYDQGDLEGAKRAFREALEVDAVHVPARNHLAVVLFREQDYAGAADLWGEVLELALAREIALPEPVELNLARAQKLAGRDADAIATIEGFLIREPTSPFAAEAAEMLRRL